MNDFQRVLDFWFEEVDPKQWFIKDVRLDEQIKERFLSLLQQAKRGELYHWRHCPGGRVAEIIVLDQFSRNIYRETPQAFSSDPMALTLAQEAVMAGIDHELDAAQLAFLLMPYTHSESQLIHEVAIELFSDERLKNSFEYERRHKAIIDRFGRYPHRNHILSRPSTAEELEFLQQPGSSF